MKKRLFALLVAGMMAVVPLTVRADDADLEARVAALEERVAALEAQLGSPNGTSEVAEQQAVEPGSVTTGMVAGGCSLEYKRFELGKSFDGQDAVILYFDFTNGSGKTASAGFSFFVKVFQNNREMESAVISDNQACDDQYTEFRSGADPVEVAFASKITDTSDIIVNISSMSDWSAEDVEFNVSLTQ